MIMNFPWNKEKMTKPKEPRKEMTPADYERLGRAMEEVFQTGYASKKRLILMSLYRGIGYGLGIFIGGTIIVGLIAYTISQFETVPFLREIIEPIKNTIQDVNGGPIVPSSTQQ